MAPPPEPTQTRPMLCRRPRSTGHGHAETHFRNRAETSRRGSSHATIHLGIDSIEDTSLRADKPHRRLAFGQPGVVRTGLDPSHKHRWESPAAGTTPHRPPAGPATRA